MPEKPVMHGYDHRPGGFDPNLTGPWHYVLVSGGGAWSGATNYAVGDAASHDVFQYLCIIPNKNVQPGVNSHWANYWIIDAPLFQNSWTNYGGSHTHMRYKLALGPPHFLDKDDGSVVSYSPNQVEVQGSVAGGSAGTTIFTLPQAYSPDSNLHLSACDDAGAFICITVQSSGDVIDGFV